jgi:hypothetical protein
MPPRSRKKRWWLRNSTRAASATVPDAMLYQLNHRRVICSRADVRPRGGACGSGPEPRRHTVARHRIFGTSFASIYPLYVQKAGRKGRGQDEVDQVITWLTGYDDAGLQEAIAREVDLETFFAEAPHLNPGASLIKGVICGHRVEEIEDPLMQKIRYLDKLVDELARGKKMASILRGSDRVGG